jgi:ribosomal protein L31
MKTAGNSLVLPSTWAICKRGMDHHYGTTSETGEPDCSVTLCGLCHAFWTGEFRPERSMSFPPGRKWPCPLRWTWRWAARWRCWPDSRSQGPRSSGSGTDRWLLPHTPCSSYFASRWAHTPQARSRDTLDISLMNYYDKTFIIKKVFYSFLWINTLGIISLQLDNNVFQNVCLGAGW